MNTLQLPSENKQTNTTMSTYIRMSLTRDTGLLMLSTRTLDLAHIKV
jgi:hypothetical protein